MKFPHLFFFGFPTILWTFAAGCQSNPVNDTEHDANSPSSDAAVVSEDAPTVSADASVFLSVQKEISLINECCTAPGQIDECYMEDVVEDGGRIDCDNNADCAPGQVCNTSFGSSGYRGRCSCDENADCRDDDGNGYGICYKSQHICGPSFCNGYYICSCWGGCVWWSSGSSDATPLEQAEALDINCCEHNYPYDGSYGSISPDSCSGGTGDGGNIDPYCLSDDECDDENDCTDDACAGPEGFRVCIHTVDEGSLCEADGLGCTIDICQANGSCDNYSAACTPDTYVQPDGEPALNTCTEDCVEDPSDLDGDGRRYSCLVPLASPSDTAEKPSDGNCDYWTCSEGAVVIPVHVITDCSGLSDECNIYTCDPSGARDNCDVPEPLLGDECPSSNPFDRCIAAVCADSNGDGIATCEDYNLPAPIEDADVCNTLTCNPADGSWSWVADQIGESCNDNLLCTETDICTAAGTCEGIFNDCTAQNDDCRAFTCNPASGACEVSAIAEGSSCNDGDGLSCTIGSCDSGGDCASAEITCSGTAPECNEYGCIEEITGCGYAVDSSKLGLPCDSLAAADNCTTLCQADFHSNITLRDAGYQEGFCSLGSALNDSCDDALLIHEFEESDTGPYGLSGSTECAVNHHVTANTSCQVNGVLLGQNGNDAVYKFTYIPSTDCTHKCQSDADCNDSSSCTNDSCNEVSGECTNEDNGSCTELFVVPGRIEAEDFKLAYETSSGNSGSSGCTSSVNGDVDINLTSDAGGGCKITKGEKDEWLQYTILISQVAEYTATLRVASNKTNRSATVSIDGVAVGTYTSPSDGKDAFEDKEVLLGTLSVGEHQLRVRFDSNNHNLNYIDIAKTGTGGTTCNTEYVVKVESDFDAVVYVSKSDCDLTDVPSSNCTETQLGDLAEDHCGSPFSCAQVDGSYSADLATAVISEEPDDDTLQTVYIFVDSQTAMSAGSFYVSVESRLQCPHPSTWYSGVIHNRLELGAGNTGTKTVQATIRDFSSAHPDFEFYMGSAQTTGLVNETLGSDHKPVFKSTGCSSPNGCQLTGAAEFDQWYNTIDGLNYEKSVEFILQPSIYSTDEYIFESNQFFPLSTSEGFGDEGYRDDAATLRNFHFTTEIHTQFTYEPEQIFAFEGDDDLWVFVDNSLVIDLGGVHAAVSGQVEMDTLGLVEGNTYAMDIFHAERHTVKSNFKITTNIVNLLTELMQIPINGVDFPDLDPNTQMGNDGRTANAVLLSGDTRLSTNAYTGEDGDSPYLFAGNDEMWELGPVTDGASVNISLCDFGGDADISFGADPSIALFNCHGERIAFNNNGVGCGDSRSAIEPVGPLDAGEAPYYLLIDGYYAPGYSGVSGGYSYDASLYYDPGVSTPWEDTDPDTDTDTNTPPIISCDPDASVFNFVTDIEQGNPNMGDLRFYPEGCVLVYDEDRNWFETGTPPHGGGPYSGIQLNTSGIKPGNSRCYNPTIPNGYSYCFPFRFYYDLLYTDNTGTKQCRLQGYVDCHDGHFNTCTGGYYDNGIIPTPQACPTDPTCDEFVNMGIGWSYPPDLTEEQRAVCETNCVSTNTFFLRVP